MTSTIVPAAPRPPAARVADGAAWLDLHQPGWTALVDVDLLQLDDPQECVLGQVYGDYLTVATLTLGEAIEYGFESVEVLDDGNDVEATLRMDDEYDALEDAWRALIRQRHADPREAQVTR
jgi:hypothetical protein